MYIEAMVAPVKTARKDDYERASRTIARLFRDHGAVSYEESWGADVPVGERTSFPRAVVLEEDETCVICIITFADKATRDSCMAAVMAAPEAQALMPEMPLDGKRMIFGGFETFVSA